MSAWIPALHAGMTQSGGLLEVIEVPPSSIFKGGREEREVQSLEYMNPSCPLRRCSGHASGAWW
jgi:hypothetical protein